ncbi:MAG: MOSC domain-containing protein [Burkholderiales bacterium]
MSALSADSNVSAGSVHARIEQLLVYPVKSCAGVLLPEAVLTAAGLEFDRAWMLVDQNGEFVSQRELPRMALVQPQLKHNELVLRAPGMLALHVALDAVEQPAPVQLWGERLDAWDMGALCAQWFSDFLLADKSADSAAARSGITHLRMVRFDPDCSRLSDKKWTGGADAENQFNDGFALLVLSQASLAQLNDKLQAAGHASVEMARFRPNIVLSGLQAHEEDQLDVLRLLHTQTDAASADASADVALRLVKPCPRCPIPNINPVTASSSPEVGDTLQSYRQNPQQNGAVCFGMNAIVQAGDGALLRVGQVLAADHRFG